MSFYFDLTTPLEKLLAKTSLESALLREFRNIGWELSPERARVRLTGPETHYYAADKALPAPVEFHSAFSSYLDVYLYHARKRQYCFAYDDVWTGYFIADHLTQCQHSGEPVRLIHLDDHTDMMSTLLVREGSGLKDLQADAIFDPLCTGQWVEAISNGSITIGNFLTALFYMPNDFQICHLNNFDTSDYQQYEVEAADKPSRLLKNISFATIHKRQAARKIRLGTYMGGNNPSRVVENFSNKNVMVHIDLDYFINDCNGNLDCKSQDIEGLRASASAKIVQFFDAINSNHIKVDLWIICTSPGFCSYLHWDWLIEAISEGIKAIN